MQKKISSFFRPAPEASSQTPASVPNYDSCAGDKWEDKKPNICIKYTRKAPKTNHSTILSPTPKPPCTRGDSPVTANLNEESSHEEGVDQTSFEDEDTLKLSPSKGKVLNKKRNYAQFHLELGQPDFLLHTCSTCGIKYAKGEPVDEKVHNTFHKNYTHGVHFKGWRHERIIHMPHVKGGRVVLVLKGDPSAQKNKVQEVLKMMEIELGDGWITHDLCKVYLFISSHRVAGCLVAEQIKEAHKVVSNTVDDDLDTTTALILSPPSTKLQFGEVTFLREVYRRIPFAKNSSADNMLSRPIISEEEPTPASCGIRAIWVSPFNRRKHIATYLLDAVRRSFCEGSVLDLSQMAFSQPTSAGKALASRYMGTKSFLVYKTA